MRRAGQLALTMIVALVALVAAGAAPPASGDLILFTTDSAADGSREIHAVPFQGGAGRRVTRNSPQGLAPAWSPTGGRIAFLASELDDMITRWARGDEVAVWTVDPAGRRLRRISILDDPERVVWSPDGRRLAVISEGDVYVVRADGSMPRRVSSRLFGVMEVAWSPDGRRLAVAEWGGDRLGGGISVVDANGGAFRRITRRQSRGEIAGESPIVSPVWAPDGKRIAYLRGSGAYGEDEYLLHLMVAETGRRKERRVARGQIYGAQWSPDGRRLALVTPHGIEVVRSNGESRRKVGDPPGDEYALAWSHDSSQILTAAATRSGTTLHVARADRPGFGRLRAPRASLLRSVYGGDQQWDPRGRALVTAHIGNQFDDPLAYLELVRSDGSRTRLLRPAIDGAPAWSPRGDGFAFERTHGTLRYTVHVARANGSGVRRLGAGRKPQWSPDGRYIAFLQGSSIITVEASGRNARRVANGSSPRWSPDSRSLAFIQGGSAWLVGRSGGPARVVVPRDASDLGCRPAFYRVAWAPDANKLAALASCGGDYYVGGLYTVNADGSNLVLIKTLDGDEDSLVWSPDGSKIAYSAFGGAGVFTIGPDGNHLRKIADRGRSLAWSPDSRRLAFVRETSRLGEGNVADHDVWVMNADGAGKRAVTRFGNNLEPVWRPR